MTADGNTMFFVSDRKGNKSMTDIYMVQKNGKQWGEAKPVSDSINTPFRETTPYITPDGSFLFFSSDGHVGMGGYDIFVSENMGKYWTKPKNLGIQINSVNDDTHFSLYEKLGKLMFTTTTIEGLKSHLDIYQIDLKLMELPIELK
jgi:Tol biopolymer transport system component